MAEYPSWALRILESVCFCCRQKETGERRADKIAQQDRVVRKGSQRLNLEEWQRETQFPKENWKEVKEREEKARRKYHGRNLMKKGQTLKKPKRLNATQTEECPSSGLDHEILHL